MHALIDSIKLPFLGTRQEDHSCFEYLLMDFDVRSLTIAVPKWLVNRGRINRDDRIDFHIPFELNKNFVSSGRITSTRWDEIDQAQICEAELDQGDARPQNVYISLDSDSITISLREFSAAENVLLKVLKDSILLKKGLEIYLKHLIPYFPRITQYPAKDYPQFKAFVLEDMLEKIKAHRKALEERYGTIAAEMKFLSEMPRFVDLEQLREVMESEIYADTLKIALSDKSVDLYLDAIKHLENTLYSNYNTLVMLYVKSL